MEYSGTHEDPGTCELIESEDTHRTFFSALKDLVISIVCENIGHEWDWVEPENLDMIEDKK